MAYLVNITARAQCDLDHIYAAVRAEYSDAAFQWFNGLERAVLSLEHSPARCPVTREDARLRHLRYGKRPGVYRAIYRVSEQQKQVDFLHIRHAARRAFKNSNLA